MSLARVLTDMVWLECTVGYYKHFILRSELYYNLFLSKQLSEQQHKNYRFNRLLSRKKPNIVDTTAAV